MKKRTIFLFCLTLTSVVLLAQQTESQNPMDADAPELTDSGYQIPEHKISTDERPMSLGVEACFMLYLKDVKPKKLKTYWDDYMKQKFNTKSKKVKGNKHERKYQNVAIYDIGYDQLDIYRVVYEQDGMTEFVLWLTNGEKFIAPYRDESTSDKVKSFLKDFGIYVEKRKIEEELSEEEHQLSELNKKQNKLIKEKEKLEKKIADWEKNITKAKEKIQQNIVDQEGKAVEIEDQSKVVEAVKNKLKKF